MQIELRDVCGFSSRVGNDVVRLTPGEISAVEGALQEWRELAVPAKPNLASQRWGVPSALVRVDMAPLRTLGEHEHFLYEVEGGPGGLGFLSVLGGDEPFRRIANALVGLGIREIGWEVDPSRVRFEAELSQGVTSLSRSGLSVTRGTNHGLPLLLRASGENDFPWERCLCDYSSGGGDKRSLKPFGAVLADEISDPFAAFPKGFAIKPRRGTGTKDVHVWVPYQPYKEFSTTQTKAWRIHQVALGAPGRWVLQPFFPPEYLEEEKALRIWRLFAVWDGKSYRTVGGVWVARRSLRVHGASDSIYGLVTVP